MKGAFFFLSGIESIDNNPVLGSPGTMRLVAGRGFGCVPLGFSARESVEAGASLSRRTKKAVARRIVSTLPQVAESDWNPSKLYVGGRVATYHKQT
jgi:hypothetical protein